MSGLTDSYYDSPPANHRFSLTNVSWAGRHEEWCYEENIFMYILGCEEVSDDDIEVPEGTVFQEMRPGVGFKTGDFVATKVGAGLP